ASWPEVPVNVVRPRASAQDKGAYDDQAAKLAGMFHDNFKAFADQVPESIAAAGPRAGDRKTVS
ncbi:MAG: hypothetical protein KDI67_04535, partial [Gammaproteobacteria bacterium]|nr:hypothetical protein [Gammaproteobacteria bacterium]